MVVMETVWSTKLKLFATWLFTEEVCGLLPQNTDWAKGGRIPGLNPGSAKSYVSLGKLLNICIPQSPRK